MQRKFVYFYFMNVKPGEIIKLKQEHIDYWRKKNLPNYKGGPFADRLGGLISFDAESLEEATELAMNDPVVLENLIADKWIREWIV